MVDTEVTVRGVVTLITEENGFYLEETGAQSAGSASRALFISTEQPLPDVYAGQLLELSGRVSELGDKRDKLTSLVEITEHTVCSDSAGLPLSKASLPMGSEARETLEGMRVVFEQELTITDVYKMHDGELTFSSDGVLRVPTRSGAAGACSATI